MGPEEPYRIDAVEQLPEAARGADHGADGFGRSRKRGIEGKWVEADALGHLVMPASCAGIEPPDQRGPVQAFGHAGEEADERQLSPQLPIGPAVREVAEDSKPHARQRTR
jgi:hypothetical protein